MRLVDDSRAPELQDLDGRIDAFTWPVLKSKHTASKAGAATARVPLLTFKRILVALDDDASAANLLSWAKALDKAFRPQIRIVNAVVAPRLYEFYSEFGPAGDPTPYIRRQEARAREFVNDAQALLGKAGVRAEAETVDGFAAEGILKAAKEFRADLVVLGSHSRGRLGRIMVGSVADAVKNHSDASVLIVRGKAPVERILVATDGSPHSKRAAGLGIRLAHLWGANARMLHVIDPFLVRWLGVDKEDLRALAKQRRRDPDSHVAWEVRHGLPPEQIVECAEKRAAGLIVLGSRGLGGFKGLLLGSVTNKVAHAAKTSVLIVRDHS